MRRFVVPQHVSEETMYSDKAVAILPYGGGLGVRPGQRSLDDLKWPLGRPMRLEGCNIDELGSLDHLLLYPRRQHYSNLRLGCSARVSIMVVEPLGHTQPSCQTAQVFS